MLEQLFCDEEVTKCSCGHLAIDHHGIDRNPHNGGCFGSGSGHPWSPIPKCGCTRTCTDVLSSGDPAPAGWRSAPTEAEPDHIERIQDHTDGSK